MAGIGGIDGLATGLDTQELIDLMLALDKRPITNMQNRIAANADVVGAYENLEANLLALKIDAKGVYRKSTLLSYSAVSSDEDILTTSTESSVAQGRYTLTVSQLAQIHQLATETFSDKDLTTVGTGTISIRTADSQAVQITIDSENNTLEGIADAINDSEAGVRAQIVDISGDGSSYKLLLSGNDTGANERIIIDEDLNGGTGLQLGSVAGVLNGTWNGTSQAASGGNYTGNVETTFTFTVDSGGTVGSDEIVLSYSDGGDISGTVTIPSSAAAGTEFEFYGGAKISLEAGTVAAADTFTVDVESSTIQAPLDSQVALGSIAGGGTPITVESSTNTVSGLIDGVTLDLHKADPSSLVTIDIGVDTESMKESVEKFINRFNDIVEIFNKHFTYDAEAEQEGGVLFGDQYAVRLSEAIRNKMTERVFGAGDYYNNLGAIGIGTLQDGTLSIDSVALQEAIEDHPENVANMFSSSGTTSDSSVQFLLASSETKPSYLVDENGYDVNITVAASQAKIDSASITSPSGGSPLLIDSSNNVLQIKVNGDISSELLIETGSYTVGSQLAGAIEDAVNADTGLGSSDIEVNFIDDGGGVGHFEFNTDLYGSNSTIEFEDVAANSIYSDIGISTGSYKRGTDVAGTINGEEATGRGRTLTGSDGNEYTDGMQLLIALTPAQLASQGADQGKVIVSKGIGSRVTDYITQITKENGAISAKKTALEAMENTMEEQIEIIQARIDKKRDRLVTRFINLETAISGFKAQESFMNYMLVQIKANSLYAGNSN